jgi:hypothetical protein
MNSHHISRRSFIRVLAGLFAFVPAARSLTAFPFDSADEPPIMSKEEFEEALKARIAEGDVLALEGDSIWIRDRWYGGRLRLVITDESIVWKGKYNKGKDFHSYPHMIEPGDDVIALGQRNGVDFSVEKMYANILNTYITVDEISLEKDEAIVSYTDASEKVGTVKVRPDYLIDKALYQEVVSKSQQLRGTKVQVIGLPLQDGTIVAANVLIGGRG